MANEVPPPAILGKSETHGNKRQINESIPFRRLPAFFAAVFLAGSIAACSGASTSAQSASAESTSTQSASSSSSPDWDTPPEEVSQDDLRQDILDTCNRLLPQGFMLECGIIDDEYETDNVRLTTNGDFWLEYTRTPIQDYDYEYTFNWHSAKMSTCHADLDIEVNEGLERFAWPYDKPFPMAVERTNMNVNGIDWKIVYATDNENRDKFTGLAIAQIGSDALRVRTDTVDYREDFEACSIDEYMVPILENIHAK